MQSERLSMRATAYARGPEAHGMLFLLRAMSCVLLVPGVALAATPGLLLMA